MAGVGTVGKEAIRRISGKRESWFRQEVGKPEGEGFSGESA